MTNTKEQLIEKLIKAGHITFSEALILIEGEKEFINYPYYPIQPQIFPPISQPFQPYYYEWKSDIPNMYPTVFCFNTSNKHD